MRYTALICALVSCSGEVPTPHSSGSATVSTPDPTHFLTWAPDGGTPVEVGLLSVVYAVVAGDCAPSVVAHAHVESYDGSLELYFDRAPAVGVRSPLSLSDEPGISPLVMVSFDPYRSEHYYGGEVEVLRFDRGGWSFRLDGDTFELCVDDLCNPHPGGTVTIEPVGGDSDHLGSPWVDGCYSGLPYTWPDGWQACRIEWLNNGEATCPETSPW